VELDDTLPQMLKEFAIFHALFSTLCLGAAMYRLRPLASRHSVAVRPRLFRRLPRRSPDIGNSPMLWKEVFIEPGLRLHWALRVLGLLIVLASFAPMLRIMWDNVLFSLAIDSWDFDIRWNSMAEDMNVWVQASTAIAGTIMWLAVAVRAAGSISGERARQTFDDLLTTPLTLSEIVRGKWIGAVLSIRGFWVWLGLVLFFGLCTGGVNGLGAVFVVLYWFLIASLLAATGLWFSTVCRTTLRATVYTLLTTVLLLGGHWLLSGLFCFLPLNVSGGNSLLWQEMTEEEWLAAVFSGFTPPFVLARCAFYEVMPDKTMPSQEDKTFVVSSFIGLLASGIAIPVILRGIRNRLAWQYNRVSITPPVTPALER
jgi:ABC-type transport system involved in multi-copper enzyme maturation permease subunit